MPENQSSYTTALLAGVVVLAILMGLGWWYVQSRSILPIAEGDTVASWDFQGAATGNSELEQKTRNEIKRLESQLGGDQSGGAENPTDYLLYVGIAAQYDTLGDGKKAKKYLEKALAIDSVKTGLAWNNLGNLMARLGAKNTARIAYAKAVEAQSQVVGYHLSRIQFLIDNFASDASAVDGAFAEAAPLGDDNSILQLKAQWYEKSNRIPDAIAALEKMKARMPADSQSVIDSEIERLKKL